MKNRGIEELRRDWRVEKRREATVSVGECALDLVCAALAMDDDHLPLSRHETGKQAAEAEDDDRANHAACRETVG